MAEYCSQCTPFDVSDIDLMEMAIELEKGHSKSFICEGCNNRGLFKDETGRLFLAKLSNGEVELHPVNLEELIKTDPNG